MTTFEFTNDGTYKQPPPFPEHRLSRILHTLCARHPEVRTGECCLGGEIDDLRFKNEVLTNALKSMKHANNIREMLDLAADALSKTSNH